MVLLRILGRRRLHLLPLALTTLTFVALTQHPLPNHATMICPIQNAKPQMMLFDFMQTFDNLYHSDAPALKWITNWTVAATIMNFVVCAFIGASLALHVVTWPLMIAFAVGLTVLFELTQLTGAWGLYPCAWRKFDVDDLMLNALGVAFGWVWVHLKRLHM